MAYWLVKTEPSEYSFDDLVKDKTTVWSGVSNALALKHMREMKKGDAVLVYHTGDERAIVGVAEISKAPYREASEKNEKLVVVDLKAKKKLAKPVTLETIKADKAFADFALVRIGRLSVMPVSDTQWERIQSLAK